MKYFKTGLCVLFLVVGMLVTNLWNNAIQPEVATELAMEQFVNPSIATDTQLRLLNDSDPTVLVWFIVIVLSLLVWLPEFFDYVKGNVSDE